MGSFRIDIAALALGGSGWLPRPAETALQDLTFEPLDRPCVLSSRSPEISGRGADGPQLRLITPAVAAPEQMKPDRQPLRPPSLYELITSDLLRDFLTAEHHSHPWPPGIPGDGYAPDTGGLLS